MKNTHIPEGLLRGYLDQEVPVEEMKQIRQHLVGCPHCQVALQTLRLRAQEVDQRLVGLSSIRPAASMPPSTAFSRFNLYCNQKEVPDMLHKLFAPRFRLAWIGISLILILSLSMAFPSVRAIANSFLGLFRVQSIKVVQVDPGNLPDQLSSSSTLESLFAEDVHTEMNGKLVTVTNVAEASAQAGFDVRLPAADGSPRLEVMPGGKMSVKVDLGKARAVLKEIGRTDIQLPAELDGAQVTVDIPKVVTASFGDCPSTQDVQSFNPDPTDPDIQATFGACTVFTQMQSPTVNAPEGLDINKIGEALLELLGMSPADAAHFSDNIDWTTTLVVPLPSYIGATFQDMPVDGVTGTLILQNEGQSSRYLLMWVKNGMVYALSGPGNSVQAARLAGSFK